MRADVDQFMQLAVDTATAAYDDGGSQRAMVISDAPAASSNDAVPASSSSGVVAPSTRLFNQRIRRAKTNLPNMPSETAPLSFKFNFATQEKLRALACSHARPVYS